MHWFQSIDLICSIFSDISLLPIQEFLHLIFVPRKFLEVGKIGLLKSTQCCSRFIQNAQKENTNGRDFLLHSRKIKSLSAYVYNADSYEQCCMNLSKSLPSSRSPSHPSGQVKLHTVHLLRSLSLSCDD